MPILPKNNMNYLSKKRSWGTTTSTTYERDYETRTAYAGQERDFSKRRNAKAVSITYRKKVFILFSTTYIEFYDSFITLQNGTNQFLVAPYT